MSYYDALKTKLDSLTGTDDQKLQTVNSTMVDAGTKVVPVIDIMTYLRENNLWGAIKSAQTTSVGAAAAVDYNSDPRVQNIDFSLPIVQGMLQDMKTHALLTDANIADLNAMAKVTKSWWQANGYGGPLSSNDIAAMNAHNAELKAAQDALAAHQAQLATLQAATPVDNNAVAAMQRNIANDNATIARLTNG